MRAVALSIGLAVLSLHAHGAAQSGAAGQAAAPAGAPASATAAPSAPASSSAAPAPEPLAPDATTLVAPTASVPEPSICTPACRAGFACVSGQCISACNPVCDAGYLCTADAQCARTPVAAPAGLRFFQGPLDERPPADPSAETHDGFMLRVALGFGGASAKQTNVAADAGFAVADDAQTTFYGSGASLSVDVGGAAGANVMVHGRFASLAINDPKRLIDGAKYRSINDTYVAAFLLAPAVTYYFMPANVYLTGAVGLSSLALHYRSTSGETHERATGVGLGFNIDVGKEWWADSQWGIGVAGRFWYSRISDNAAIGRLEYNFIGAALLCSATYQ